MGAPGDGLLIINDCSTATCCQHTICGRGEGDVIEVFEDNREQIDEYETDSDEVESDFKEHSELFNRACVT